jgi:rhodanese-related sulfurtransferase
MSMGIALGLPGNSSTSITLAEVQSAFLESRPPLVIDARCQQEFRGATDTIQGALWRDPERVAEWVGELPRSSRVVVYCADGGETSQGVAQALRERGPSARYLQGGMRGWKAAGGALDRKAAGANTRWVTRERPKIDRIACPWLLARFVDPEAEFLYVPAKAVLEAAKGRDAVPYDIPDVHFSHEGERCSFDAFLRHYHLDDPALAQLALIVRGADTARLDLAPQASGLAAISLGLSRRFPDDHEMLRHGLVIYDALYAWCKGGQDKVHTWNPVAYR